MHGRSGGPAPNSNCVDEIPWTIYPTNTDCNIHLLSESVNYLFQEGSEEIKPRPVKE